MAACGSASRQATAATSAPSTTVAVQALQDEFGTDNAPFLDALKANAGFPAYEQTASDSGHLLDTFKWPTSVAADVQQFSADYSVIGSSGADYNGLSVALTKWKTAYDKVCGDLGLPEPFA